METLATAINTSFEMAQLPHILKIATVIPIYKGGDINKVCNFRPIALLPTLSKVIEKLVKDRVLKFLKLHNILSFSQYGFQTNKTTDAIFSFLESLYLSVNDGSSAVAVFCDFSKAFDCVNHKILLSKLSMYGFRGTSLDWFSAYLSGRVQQVQL